MTRKSMHGGMFVEQLSPNITLSSTGIGAAIDLYREMGDGTDPASVVVHPYSVEQAYQLYREFPDMHRLLVVPMPGVAHDFWFVAGVNGIVLGWRP